MISSLVVVASDEFKNDIKNIKNTSLEQSIENNHIVLIEASDFNETLRIFNEIKALSSVRDVNMAFSEAPDFCEEFSAEKIAQKVNELSNAENIEYYGNIYKNY